MTWPNRTGASRARSHVTVLLVLTGVLLPGPVAAAAEIVVEGQVLNDLGGGVLGASVRIETVPGAGERAKVLAGGQTNRTGDFKLDLPPGTTGRIVVRVLAEGFKQFSRTVDLAEDDEPFIVAELVGALSLTGRVTRGPTTQPVRAARVTYHTASGARRTRTARDGRYKIDGLQPGPGRLEVAADGFAHERVRVKLDQTRTLDVELRPELQVQITVVDDRSRPVPDVTIEAISDDPPRSYSTITDGSGRATLRGVHPDVTELRARLLTDVHVTPPHWDRIISLPGGQERITQRFVLPRPARLEGRVLRARDGKPVPLARVSVGANKASFLFSTNTDRRGRFRIIGLPAREVVVTAQHPEWAPDLRTARLKPDRTSRIKLLLPPGATLIGVVKDDDGRPITDADVLASGWRDYDTLALHAKTDPNGEFIIEHVPFDGVSLEVRAAGFEPQPTGPLKPGRKRHEVVIYPREDLASRGPAGIAAGQLKSLLNAKTLDGKTLTAEQLQGKFVLLDFWATWCPPCRAEIPHVKAAAKALARRKDFAIIGVSLDEDEQALRKFIRDHRITWPQLFGQAGRVPTIARVFGVRAIPSTFLIAPEGNVIAKDLRGRDLTRQLEKHLNRPRPRERSHERPGF